MNFFKDNIGLYLDYYELTMAQGYFLTGIGNRQANFDYFFRNNPFNSGYAIFAGLQDMLELISEFTYNNGAIDFLHKHGFKNEFLDYLKNFKFSGNIFSVPEGEIVFPNEPLIRVEGSIIETQLLESIILNVINFESLIATKARRLRYSAGKRKLADFGLRRAQGFAALFASKAAIIGGMDNTSNVYSAFIYDLIPTGTQAHSWIQSFGDELTAFRKFAELYPDNCVLLVDTYDTLKSGIPNAIKIAKEMEQNGHKLSAVRLDSGDLAYLSKKARKMLDEAELNYVKIIASNQLDEYLIKSLIEQGAPIDAFGVGTNLITGQKDAALDGVYKISTINNNPTIKLSEDVSKITLPGIKKIYRYFNGENKFYADCIALENETDIDVMLHPHDIYKKCKLKDLHYESLTAQVFKNGAPSINFKSVKEIAAYSEYRFSLLPDEHKRFEFPHIYKVGLSPNLKQLRDELITKMKGGV
ncbi:nicotinate phosphoribosyltransferase [Melioribacteraceae bacterium 4301-Me]|uniref:nicotinate phosphoribosyltransferase n=1 Tax=Pyranulibacter aquaticus TaxID=3163344 RepID=UPI00359B3464